MKILLTLIFLATLFFARAQKFSGQLENHDKGEREQKYQQQPPDIRFAF